MSGREWRIHPASLWPWWLASAGAMALSGWSWIFAAAGLWMAASAALRLLTTSASMSDGRICVSTGFFRRVRVDALAGPALGVEVSKGPPGMLFGYGDVTLSTGAAIVRLEGLADADGFRAAATGVDTGVAGM